MKKLKQILEEWELPCGVGISMKMGVSGYDASLLPCSDHNGVLPVHRYAYLNEVKLSRDNLMLLGKLAYRRLSDGELPTEEEVLEHQRLFVPKEVEIKRPRAAQLPMEGVFAKGLLQVKTEANIEEPIVVVMNSSLKGEMHLNVSIKKGAKAKIVIFSQLDVTSVQCVRLVQEAGSRLELIWIPLQTTAESYLALHATLDHDAHLDLHQPCMDASVHFSNQIEQRGNRTKVNCYAPVFSSEKNKMTIETSIKDFAHHSFSRINYKAVLDEQAEVNYYGRQIIDAKSRDCDSYQESRFLVLDERVKAHSHPVMVIDNNELSAGHASSVGSLDEEQLFYLESRGLSRSMAQSLMTQAFLRPSLEAIAVEPIRKYLLENLLKKVELT